MNHIKRILLTTAVALTSFAEAQITVDDVAVEHIYSPREVDVRTARDGTHYTQLQDAKRVVLFDFATGRQTTSLIDLAQIDDCPISRIDDYQLSPQGTHLLVATADSAHFRHTSSAYYYVYDIAYRTLTPLCDEGRQMCPSFAPNGSMIAFVRDNNLYVRKLRYNSVSPVTTDGSDSIFNAVPDWLYEEEFGLKTTYAWSPDSKELAYVRLDLTNVKSLNIKSLTGAVDDLTYRYAKAGAANPKASVQVFNIENRTTKTMNIGDGDGYVPRLQFTGNERELAIVKLNRRQNTLDIFVGNTASTVCRSVLTDRRARYVDMKSLDGIFFLPDGKNFLYLETVDNWRHVVLYGMNGVRKIQLTKGDFDVHQILGFDAATKSVFYCASRRSPLLRDLYSVSLDGVKDVCLTSSLPGTHEAIFSASGKFFIDRYSTSSSPTTTCICSSLGKQIKVLDKSDDVLNALKQKPVAQKEFVTIQVDLNLIFNAIVIKPKDFDAAKKYPLAGLQYSGPGSQFVRDAWDVGWEQLLAQEGYVVLGVDPRGTDSRGEEWRTCNYQKIGVTEADDIIKAVEKFSQEKYVDSQRVAIAGWSYGGYIASLVMTRTDAFRTAIAIAPVTDWKLYDSAYTERYMRKPDENPSGYDAASVVRAADKISGRLLLVHGSGDDNVHVENTLQLSSALIAAGKQFDQFIYPDLRHNLSSHAAKRHLYVMLLDFLRRNL